MGSMDRYRSSRLVLILAAVVFGLGLSSCETAPKEPVVPLATEGVETGAPKSAAPENREPIEVQWDRLEMPLEPEAAFEEWMVPSRVKELEGKQVRIKGLMYSGGLSQRSNIREFPLIREAGCQFGSGAPAWHVIMVELAGKLRTEYKTELITVEGILHVKPYNGADGKTWSVYFLQGTKVE